jgi:hypothetical protein
MLTEHFYPELGYKFPSFPYLSFDRALNVAARTLCRIGLVWRKELMPVDWRKGEPEYLLFLPQGTRIVQILSFGDLEATTRERIEAIDPRWQERFGTPREYFRAGVDTVWVNPPPVADAPNAVLPYVALAPTIEGRDLSDDYAWDYERLLLIGAIAHLGGASWPDFEHLCLTARSRAVDNNHVGVPRQVRYAGY